MCTQIWNICNWYSFFFLVVDGTKPYDARSFPIPRNGLELGLEKSPGHNGSFLKVSSMTVGYYLFLPNVA